MDIYSLITLPGKVILLTYNMSYKTLSVIGRMRDVYCCIAGKADDGASKPVLVLCGA